MGKVNMVKHIKEIHPEALVLLKVGAFYETYGKDAYIIAYLFDYRLKEESKVPKSGFGRSALKKVLTKIEEEKIDYLLLDVRNNYDVDEKQENRNLNRYTEVYEKSRKYVKKKRKIAEIIDLMNKMIEKEDFDKKIKQIEVFLSEARKI